MVTAGDSDVNVPSECCRLHLTLMKSMKYQFKVGGKFQQGMHVRRIKSAFDYTHRLT